MFEPEDAYMDEYSDAPDIAEVDDEMDAFLSEPDDDLQQADDDGAEEEAPRPKKGRPTLRVVK